VNQRHVAIIMDGNGRWAARRNLPRLEGHRAGADAVRRTVEAACDPAIAGDLGTLTLFAFSGDNWGRPWPEVRGLMSLFRAYLRSETHRLVEHGIRLSVIGRRDRLSPAVVTAVEEAERGTAGGAGLHLRIAVDYSGRDAILAAAAHPGAHLSRDIFSRVMERSMHSSVACPDVDLLIRTGGEQRLSDFLLWESAYAELVFLDTMWPDFGAVDLAAALQNFRHRQRRFGLLPAPAAGNQRATTSNVASS
jgi:undecaprenyl diphosphate synthase